MCWYIKVLLIFNKMRMGGWSLEWCKIKNNEGDEMREKSFLCVFMMMYFHKRVCW